MSSDTEALRSYIFEAQGGKCLMPECNHNWTDLAHIRAASLGGPRTPSNLAGLCRVCHTNYDQSRPIMKEELLRYRKLQVLKERTWPTDDIADYWKGKLDDIYD